MKVAIRFGLGSVIAMAIAIVASGTKTPEAALVPKPIIKPLGVNDESVPAQPLDPSRPFPKPPEQGRPWIAPETSIPRDFVDAVQWVFDRGMADPRGCEYRAVELKLRNAQGDGDETIKTHAWVLPKQEGEPRRFAVCWSGVVYPIQSVGDPANLKDDVEGMIKTPARSSPNGLMSFPYPIWIGNSEPGLMMERTLRPPRIGILLRLGESKLAERLWNQIFNRTSGLDWRFFLAEEWLLAYYDQALNAHIREDDALALSVLRTLDALVGTTQKQLLDAQNEAIEKAQAMERKQPRIINRGIGQPRLPTRLNQMRGFAQLKALLADQERRAKGESGTAALGLDTRNSEPAKRIERSIRELEDVKAAIEGPFLARLEHYGHPLVNTLAAEGEAAMQALLATLESDKRLTRAVNFHNDPFPRGTIDMPHIPAPERSATPVAGIAAHLLSKMPSLLLAPDELSRPFSIQPHRADASKQAEQLRLLIKRYPGPTFPDRIFQVLEDEEDSNDQAQRNRWRMAAAWLVSRTTPEQSSRPDQLWSYLDSSRKREATSIHAQPQDVEPKDQIPMVGEPLRGRQNPSVNDLLKRGGKRFLEKRLDAFRKQPYDAVFIAAVLATWDREAGVALLRDYRATLADHPAPHALVIEPELVLIETQLHFGDKAVLKDYAAWIRSVNRIEPRTRLADMDSVFLHFRNPEVAFALEWLFNDPKSPWTEFVNQDRGFNLIRMCNHLDSRTIGCPAFRSFLLRSLENRTPLGRAQGTVDSGVRYQIEGNQPPRIGAFREEMETKADPDAPKAGETVEFRVCDEVAHLLGALDGMPNVQPYWPEPKRDEGIAQQIAFLKRYGDRFTIDPQDKTPVDLVIDPNLQRACQLRFPALNRPAEAKDVEEGRALFSLDPTAKRRTVAMLSRPMFGRWIAYKKRPYAYQIGHIDGSMEERRSFHQGGWIWQAEEVFENGAWKRYYGFVGDEAARVPAEEIRFNRPNESGNPHASSNEIVGFSLETVDFDSIQTAVTLKQPVIIAASLANQSGLDQTIPKLFVNSTGEHRRGVAIGLYYAPDDSVQTTIITPQQRRLQLLSTSGPNHWTKLAPRWDRPFPRRANEPTTTLRPGESTEAFRIDVSQWFDISKPGAYHLRVEFGPETGLAMEKPIVATKRFTVVRSTSQP